MVEVSHPSPLTRKTAQLKRALDSIVVSPHSEYLDGTLGVIDLIYQSMLNVDAARISAGQISNELFVGRRVLKRVLGEDVEKTLHPRFEL